MSELRQRLDTGEWVIMAPERLKGRELQKEKNPLQDVYPAYEKNCPFCFGNDDRYTNIEIDRINSPDTNDWTVRCVENKFQIFSNHERAPIESSEYPRNGIYHKYSRYGNHELVIESAEHNKTLGIMNHDEASNIIEMYYRRYKALNNGENRQTVLFKNHGNLSGASQKHPHSQIVSMMVVPEYIRFLVDNAMRYYDRNGRCVFCKIIENEINNEERLVYHNDKFVAIVPYASSVPFEIEIYPKRHEGGFDIMPGEDIVELSDCLRVVVSKLYQALSNPDYNIIFRNPPYHLSSILPYHWHLKVIPYLSMPGGFELGSGMRVNVMMPEDSADILRKIDVI